MYFLCFEEHRTTHYSLVCIGMLSFGGPSEPLNSEWELEFSTNPSLQFPKDKALLVRASAIHRNFLSSIDPVSAASYPGSSLELWVSRDVGIHFWALSQTSCVMMTITARSIGVM